MTRIKTEEQEIAILSTNGHGYSTSKRKIIQKDWQALVPEMDYNRKANCNNRVVLVRIVGPLCSQIGFLIDNSADTSYEVNYTVVNLTIDKMRDGGIRLIAVGGRRCSNKGDETDIYIDHYGFSACEHKTLYKEKFTEVKEMALLPLEGTLTLEDIFNYYKKSIESTNERYIKIRETSYELYDINETAYTEKQLRTPALVASWAGEVEKAKEYLEWGYQKFIEICNWRASENVKILYQSGAQWERDRNVAGLRALYQNQAYVKEKLDKWLAEQQQLIANPKQLRAATRKWISVNKLHFAPYQDIVGAAYQMGKLDS